MASYHLLEVKSTRNGEIFYMVAQRRLFRRTRYWNRLREIWEELDVDQATRSGRMSSFATAIGYHDQSGVEFGISRAMDTAKALRAGRGRRPPPKPPAAKPDYELNIITL